MGLDLNDYDFESPIGFDGENEYNFYGEEYSEFNWFKKKFLGGIKSFVKNPGKALKDLAKDTGRNVAKAGKFVWKGIASVGLLPIRLGALHVIKNNGFRIGDKLAPAYMNDNDPLLKKYKKEAIDNARKLKGTVRMWWDEVFGGKMSAFERAVLDGRGRKPQIFTKGKKVNFDGSISEYVYSHSFDGKDFVFYEYLPNDNEEQKSNFAEIITGASISAALGLLKALVEKIKSGGVPDQPYQEGTPEFNTTGGNTPSPMPEPDATSLIVSPDGKAVINPNTGETIKTAELKEQEKTNTSLQTNPDGTPKTEEKFLGMPKKVGIGVTVGVGVLALTGIIIAVARKK
jgi:hypothetical protein